MWDDALDGFSPTTMAQMFAGDPPIPGTRAPVAQYQGKNGFALSHYPESVTEDAIKVDEAETTQAALNAHLSAQYVIAQKLRPIPTLDQMKEELQLSDSSSIKQRISDLKKQHLSDLERLYAWHAEEYLDDAHDRYFSKDDLMYLADGENNPVLKDGYTQLDWLYDESRKEVHWQQQIQWHDDFEQMRYSHLTNLTSLYADLKKQETSEEEAKRLREQQFPVSIEDYNCKPKDVQLRAARFLTLGEEARQEKMLSEFGWAWRQVKPLKDIVEKDPAFKAELIASLIEIRDPRKRL